MNHEERIKKIAQRIKELRIEAGYSSYEVFAIDKNLDRKQYWRMEKGQNFKITSLFNIIDAHGITLADFFKQLS